MSLLFGNIMFHIPRTNVIQSDSGFSVEVLGRTGIMYSENSRTIKIDSEVLQGPSGLIIYTDSIIRWQTPHESEKIDETCRAVIVENIKEAFKFRGIEIQVQ